MTEVPKISLEYSEISKNNESKILESCRQVIKQGIRQGLNLFRLDEIVICQNFQQKVLTFQSSVGLPQELTIEEGYGACAKIIWHPRSSQDKRAKIFINANLFLSPDGSEAFSANVLALQTLAHELGHVHNDSYVADEFGYDDIPILWGNPALITLYISKCIWSECHAEFVASTLDINGGLERNLRALRSVQDVTLSVVPCAHSQYQQDKDIFRLWSAIVTQSSIHLQAIGRIASYVTFVQTRTARESMRDFFGVFDFVSWSLISELRNLRPHFRQWHTWSWTELQKVVKDMWVMCGVRPEARDSGCYVHVLAAPSRLFQ